MLMKMPRAEKYSLLLEILPGIANIEDNWMVSSKTMFSFIIHKLCPLVVTPMKTAYGIVFFL